MEALIGFAIGYWVGTKEGREGLQKALQALDAISKSAEVKAMLSQGLAMGGGMLAQGLKSSGGFSVAQGVAGALADRAGKILSGGLRAA
jgi:hypothetical protein